MNTLVNKHKVLTAGKTARLLSKIVYYVLALILLFTGITKIFDPLPLINTLKLLPLINEQIVILIATLLPIIEIGLGLLMLLKIKPKITLPVVLMLFIIFFGFSIYGTVIGLDADCGCLSANIFGAGFGSVVKSEFGWGMIMRNFMLFILSAHISFEKKFLARKNK